MNKKSILFLTMLILSPVIIYFLWPSDKSRIKKLFREGAKAVEAEKIDDVMAKVSFNYTDEYGMSYLLIKKTMEDVFNKMGNIGIEYEIRHLEINKKSASAELDIRATASLGQDTGYIVGDAAKPVSMKFHLLKERGKWLVNKTEGLPLNY